MKKYIVVADIFRDLESNHVYHKGEEFPFDDSLISEERITELSTTNNKMNQVLISEKNLKDYNLQELMDLAKSEKIEVLDTDSEKELIQKLKDNNKAKKSIMKKLDSKKIDYKEDMLLEDLNKLLKDE